MTRVPKRHLCAAVLSGVLLLAVAGPASPAANASSSVSPCWKLLLTDWYDGTIDKTYPIPCYQQAIAHLPTDAQLYSSAKDDIQRAMARAIAAQHQATTPTTTAEATTTAAATTTTVQPDTTPTTTTTAAVTPPPTTTPTTTAQSPGRTKPKGLAHALDKLNPGEADAFPLPLLILGGLAILLVAAGVIGMVWRRMDRDDMGTP